MAGSETDAGADAVALAIRDLTLELRMTNRILCILPTLFPNGVSKHNAEELWRAVLTGTATNFESP